MTNLQDITSLHWQVCVNRPGEIVTDVDDITQCIQVILRTPKGADPHRPEFGCDLWQYIDWPIAAAQPHIIRETFDAIALWEPRAVVDSVTISIPDVGNLRLMVRWHPTDDVMATMQTTEVVI